MVMLTHMVNTAIYTPRLYVYTPIHSHCVCVCVCVCVVCVRVRACV